MVANLSFLFFLILPFQFSLGSFGTSDILAIRLLLPLLILLWFAYSLVKKKLVLPKPLTLFALTSFLVWMMLSLFWAENEAWALRKIIFWLTFFPFFLVLTALFQEEKVRTKAIKGIVWGGTLVALVGIIQFLAQLIIPIHVLSEIIFRYLSFFIGTNFGSAVAEYPSIFVNIGGATVLRAFGFFPDPHIFAYYTAMILPLALYQALSKNVSLVTKTAPVLLFIATLLSFSRASYAALLVTGVIGSILYLLLSRSRLSVPLILCIAGFGALLFISPVATRFQSSFSAEDGSVTERSRLWQEALVNISHAPLAGVGLGNYPLHVKPDAEMREPIYVHNLYLDIAVEIGLVGLFLFLLFLFSCLPTVVGRGQGLPKFSFQNKEFFSYRFALYSSLLIFLTHSLFEYPLFSVHVLTLLLAILALLYSEKYDT